jgi:hypothetical protein
MESLILDKNENDKKHSQQKKLIFILNTVYFIYMFVPIFFFDIILDNSILFHIFFLPSFLWSGFTIVGTDVWFLVFYLCAILILWSVCVVLYWLIITFLGVIKKRK